MMNNMIYVRGHPKDFDDWFKHKEGYSFMKDVEPYFKKLESFTLKSMLKLRIVTNLLIKLLFQLMGRC